MSLKKLVHPKIWKRGDGDKGDIILYALSLQGPLSPSDFIREGNEPDKIKKTTFYKYFGNLLEKNYVDVKRDEKDRKKVNYFITSSGEIYLSKRSKIYGLDYETEHKMEMRRSKNQADRLKIFFQNNKIDDYQLQIEYLNLASVITFDKVYKIFSEEEKFNKLLLFLTLNHPKFYPRYSTSIEFFKEKYNSISEGSLTTHEIGIFLERILAKKDYDTRFHKLVLPFDEITLFFTEDSEYGRVFEDTVDSHLKMFIHKTNLGIIEYNLGELAKIYQNIIIILVDKYKLFHPDTANALYNLIDDFRKEIKENIIKIPSKFIEYAKITELPEMPKSMKSIALKSIKLEGYHNFGDQKPQKSVIVDNLERSPSSFKELNYFPKDNLLKKAWELYEGRDYEGTLTQINKVLDVEDNPELYYWKAEILSFMSFAPSKYSKSTLELYEEALETIERGINLNPMPSGFNFFRLKANILYSMSNYDLALDAIEEALKIDDQEKIFEKKAQILIKLGRVDESIELYNVSHLLSKQFLINQIYNESAFFSSFQYKKYNNALELINKALKIDPDNNNALLLKSKILTNLNENDKASKMVNRLLGFDYKTVDFVKLADILFTLKRYEEAIEYSEKAVEQEKYYMPLHGPFLFKTYALILKELQRYEEALKAIEKFGAIDFDYFLIKIDILIGLQRYKVALGEVNTIIGYATNDGSIKPDDYDEDAYESLRKKIVLLILTGKPEDIVEILKPIKEKGLHLYIYTIQQLIDNNEGTIARKVLMSYYEIDPDDEYERLHDLQIEYYNEIVDKINTKKYYEALKIISEYSKLNISDSQMYKYKIDALRGLKKYDEALNVTNKAIEKWPKSPRSIPWNLTRENSSNKEEKGEVIYFYEFCRMKARILFIMDKKEEALEVIEKVIKSSPRLDDAYVIKTLILASLEKYDKAVFQICKAIELNPHKSNYYEYKSRVLNELKREDEALKAINKAIELDPNKPDNHHFKAEILVSQNKLNEALKTIDKGFELFPDYIKFLEMRNLILNLLGRYEEALDGIENALKVGAKYSGIYYKKAQLLESLNKYDVALDTINNALEINPDDRISIVLKIKILNELEKFDEALNLLEEKKNLINEDDSINDSYNNLKAQICYTKALAFARNNMREDAINMIELALDLTDPEWADYTYRYGEIMMILHDYKVATEKFESALKLAIPPLDTRIKLGRCYFELGHYYKALHNLEEGKYLGEHNIKQLVRDEKGKRFEMDLPHKGLIEEATFLIKEIHSLLLKLKSPLVKTEIYFKIGDYFVSKGNYDMAIEYFKLGKDFAIQRKENKWIEKAEHEFKRYNSFVEDFKRDFL